MEIADLCDVCVNEEAQLLCDRCGACVCLDCCVSTEDGRTFCMDCEEATDGE